LVRVNIAGTNNPVIGGDCWDFYVNVIECTPHECFPIYSNSPSSVCVGNNVNYSISFPVGCESCFGENIQWTVDGNPQIGGSNFNYYANAPGLHHICVSYSDNCKQISVVKCFDLLVLNCECGCNKSYNISDLNSHISSSNQIDGDFSIETNGNVVSSVTMDLVYFDFGTTCSTTNQPSANLGNFMPLHDYTDFNNLAHHGYLQYNAQYSRSAVYIFSPITNLMQGQLFHYQIATPSIFNNCFVQNWNYVIKVTIVFDDCTTCSCFITSFNDVMETSCHSEGLRLINQNKSNNMKIDVSPNPSNGNIKIGFINLPNDIEKTTEIIDIDGKIVSTTKVAANQNDYIVENLPNGVYFAKVICNGKQYTSKFVIAKN
jgi:hypothetical protein